MKVLLLPYENDCNNFVELAKHLMRDGHEVSVMVSDFFSVVTGRGYVKKAFLLEGFPSQSIFDLEEELKEINSYESINELNIDFSYLKMVEKTFQTGRTLNHLVYSDIYLSNSLHNRDYNYQPSNKEFVYKLLEMVLRKAERVLDEENPDVIFTFGAYNLVRNAFFELARPRKIKFFSLIQSRIRDYCTFSDNLYLGGSTEIVKEMNRIKELGLEVSLANSIIESVRDKFQATYDSSVYYNMNDLKKAFSLKTQIKPIISSFFSLPRATLKDLEVRYRGPLKDNYFYIRSVPYIWYYNLRNSIRVFRYFQNKSLNNKELPNGKFVFFSLQTVPEDIVFTQPLLADEYYNILRVSKVLPVDYKLVVKAHPTMLNVLSDAYPVGWYKKISKIHNVTLVSPFLNGVEIIKKSSAVIATNSTSLLEGAIMGKPVFSFGKTEFEMLDGVFPFSDSLFGKQLENYHLPAENNHPYYVQAVLNKGISIPFSKYWNISKSDCKESKYQDEFIKQVKTGLYNAHQESPNSLSRYSFL